MGSEVFRHTDHHAQRQRLFVGIRRQIHRAGDAGLAGHGQIQRQRHAHTVEVEGRRVKVEVFLEITRVAGSVEQNVLTVETQLVRQAVRSEDRLNRAMAGEGAVGGVGFLAEVQRRDIVRDLILAAQASDFHRIPFSVQRRFIEDVQVGGIGVVVGGGVAQRHRQHRAGVICHRRHGQRDRRVLIGAGIHIQRLRGGGNHFAVHRQCAGQRQIQRIAMIVEHAHREGDLAAAPHAGGSALQERAHRRKGALGVFPHRVGNKRRQIVLGTCVQGAQIGGDAGRFDAGGFVGVVAQQPIFKRQRLQAVPDQVEHAHLIRPFALTDQVVVAFRRDRIQTAVEGLQHLFAVQQADIVGGGIVHAAVFTDGDGFFLMGRAIVARIVQRFDIQPTAQIVAAVAAVQTGGIQLRDLLGQIVQLFGQILDIFDVFGTAHLKRRNTLVFGAPHHHRGVVAVAHDQAAQVLFAVLEEGGVVAEPAMRCPNRRFGHHHHAHFIRDVEEERRVGHRVQTDDVDIRLFRHAEVRARIFLGLDGVAHVVPGIVFQPDGTAVQHKVFVLDVEGAETDAGDLGVHRGVAIQNLRFQIIQIRGFRLPQLDVPAFVVPIHRLIVARDGEHFFVILRAVAGQRKTNLLARRVHGFVFDMQVVLVHIGIGEHIVHIGLGAFHQPAILPDTADVTAPEGAFRQIGTIAIVFVFIRRGAGSLATDQQLVFLAEFHHIGDLHLDGEERFAFFGDLFAVDIVHALVCHGIKMQENAVAFAGLVHHELAAVEADLGVVPFQRVFRIQAEVCTADVKLFAGGLFGITMRERVHIKRRGNFDGYRIPLGGQRIQRIGFAGKVPQTIQTGFR